LERHSKKEGEPDFHYDAAETAQKPPIKIFSDHGGSLGGKDREISNDQGGKGKPQPHFQASGGALLVYRGGACNTLLRKGDGGREKKGVRRTVQRPSKPWDVGGCFSKKTETGGKDEGGRQRTRTRENVGGGNLVHGH